MNIRAFNAVGCVVCKDGDLLQVTLAEAVRIDAAIKRQALGLPLENGDLNRIERYELTEP